MMALILVIILAASVSAHQIPLADHNADKVLSWMEKYGKPIDQPFSGPLSFSRLPYTLCLEDEDVTFDIAILGMPFDTGVSYRPG